jgi:hypothetical protein
LSSAASGDETVGTGPGLCHSLVLYENPVARDLVLRLCGDLIIKFEPELDFEFEWCGFNYLRLPEITRQIGHAALNADLIFVSLERVADLPTEVISWLEFWLVQRTEAGLLVLLQNANDNRDAFSWPDNCLRSIALRANIDYLPYFSPALTGLGSEKPAPDQVAPSVLPPPPCRYHSTGWGIEE